MGRPDSGRPHRPPQLDRLSFHHMALHLWRSSKRNPGLGDSSRSIHYDWADDRGAANS